jgi:hypothetical protein
MIDPILTPISVVFYAAAFVFCTYIMVYFTHPDDRNVAFFPKIVVVCSKTNPIDSKSLLENCNTDVASSVFDTLTTRNSNILL